MRAATTVGARAIAGPFLNARNTAPRSATTARNPFKHARAKNHVQTELLEIFFDQFGSEGILIFYVKFFHTYQ
jgi:hypothetical protein